RIRARSDRDDADILARFHHRLTDLVALLVRPPNFETGRTGHSVSERAHLAPFDVDEIEVEELDFGQRTAVQLVQHLCRLRTLNLIPVVPTEDRLAVGVRRRAIVAN